MTPDYFTGLDLHKRTLTATTLDAAGAVVASAKMPCRPEALFAYFAQQPGHHTATVECTTGWYWVKDTLADTVDLRLAHAKGVKAIAAAKVKTDGADAAMLAHLLRTDLLPEAHMISDEGEVISPHHARCATCSAPACASLSAAWLPRTPSHACWRSTTSKT